MKEKPIIFYPPEVRGIIGGWKTMTRRPISRLKGFGKIMPPLKLSGGKEWNFFCDNKNNWFNLTEEKLLKCSPYGEPGDVLWVKESWFNNGYPEKDKDILVYRADGEFEDHFPEDFADAHWSSPLHMPRWASRIDLEITSIRVEMLQSISGIDAKKEGVSIPAHIPNDGADLDYARAQFKLLWEPIYGAGAWNSNPWVWVIEFEACVQNLK